MNIEKSIEILKEFRKYNKFYKEENRDLTITITLEAKESIDKAIERLLTAYEKEKENNKELRKYYATRKEVEELKEINESLHDSAENYINKDKVIAKVIEVKERPVKDEFITATQGKLNTIIDIESLLDKEE